MFRRLDESTFVAAGQVRAADLAGAKALGVAMIVNNRPDGEEPGQPLSAEIEAAALAAGLGYRHIPVAGGLPADQVEAMAAALEEANGLTLAFCRSGTRSTYLWALAEASRGRDGKELVECAAAAGYDLMPIAHLL